MVACEPLATVPDLPYTPPILVPDCVPVDDGVIEPAEMPFVTGAVARVRVGKDIPVEVNGAADPDNPGRRIWDFSRPEPQEEPLGTLVVEPATGHWFDDTFSDVDVVGPLSPGNALLAPLRLTDAGVALLGTASAVEDPPSGQTLIAYDAPILLYPLPLDESTAVTTESDAINARVFGLPFAMHDTYTVEVTGRGRVILPDLILDDTLRVTLRLVRVPIAGFATQQVTHVWLTPCLGEVLRIISPAVPATEILNDAFPMAHEVWRMSL